MKKIFKIGFLFLLVFGFGNVYLPQVALADTSGPNDPATIVNNTDIGIIAWNTPEKAQHVDGFRAEASSISTGEISNYLKATDYNFNIPLDATILGIKANIIHNASFHDRIQDQEVKIIKNGNIIDTNQASSAFWSDDNEADTVASYGGETELWGETWTPSDINSPGFGLAIAVTNIGGGSRTARIDNISISITYSLPPVLNETFIIRNGDTIIYQGTVALPSSVPVSINDTSGVPHTVDAQSVLAILKTIDDTSVAFSISDLSYNDTYKSFLLNCITPLNSEPSCYNWKYVVNGSYPDVGMDKNILTGENTIYLYFGNLYKLDFDKTSIKTGESITATTQKYKYEDNTWNTLVDADIAVAVPSSYPLDVITQGVTDSEGKITLTLSSAGTYDAGILIHSDFGDYLDYPLTTIIITTATADSSGGSSSGSGGGYTPPTFNIQNALAYLKSIQSPDGSFGGSLLYTDWTAIAFGALNVTDSSKDKLFSYFSSHNTISSLLTDNERHAIALLSLGQNPYSFNDVNYIKAITDNFDGTQFGDVNLINDDIFALIPLKNSGYTATDDVVIKDINFIISKQKTDGSWEESVDVTAAAIQALKSFDSITGVTESLLKATNYLAGKQNNDGGFGDNASSIYSTSWVMQAMSALSASWTKSGKTAIDYLATQQTNANNNGAVLSSSDTLQNNIWATSYAIAGANLKPWNAIMQNFPKPTIQNENNLNTTLVNKETNTVNINIPIANKNTNNKSANKKVASIPEAKKSIAVVSQELPASPNTPEIIPDTLTATAVSPVSNQINSNIIAFVLGVFSGVIPLYFLKKFFIK